MLYQNRVIYVFKHNIHLQPLVEYCLQAGMGVKGVVKDIDTNNTIANADLMIEGIDMKFHTDENGRFFRILLPRKYILKVNWFLFEHFLKLSWNKYWFVKLKVSAANYSTMRRSFTVEKTKGYPVMKAIEVYLIQGNDLNTQYPEIEQTSIVTENTHETTESYNYNTPNIQTNINTEKLPLINNRFSDDNDNELPSDAMKNYLNQTLLLFVISLRFLFWNKN